MTERNLEIFIEVCRCGSMSAAAENLGMSQPAISLAIKEIEAYYGTPLFDRTGRSIRLRQEGKVFLDYARSILSQYEEVRDILRSGKGGEKADIGINITMAESILADLGEFLKNKYPNVELRFLVRNSTDIVQATEEGRLDFGIVNQLRAQDSLLFTKLFSEKICALVEECYVGNRLEIESLNGKNVLLREQGSGIRAMFDEMISEAGVVPHILLDSVSDLSLIQMAEKGFGIAFVTENTADRAVQKYHVKKLEIHGVHAIRTYYLVRLKKKYCSKIQNDMIEDVLHWKIG